MARTKISEFSATPASNTDIDSIFIGEGMAPSNVNDAIRELMAQLKDFQTGAVGDSFNGPVGTTTAAAGAFTTLSATGNVTLGDASTDTLNVGNGGLIKDASGNLGLGVTPSAWNASFKAMQLGNGAVFTGQNNTLDANLSSNWYYKSGAADAYIANGFATLYQQSTGKHIWLNAPSGTAGNAITFTQAMTLDASGNLLVGRTSSDGYRVAALGSTQLLSGYQLTYSGVAAGSVTLTSGGAMAFGLDASTGGTERARIDSSGRFFVGTTTGTGKVNITGTGSASASTPAINIDAGATNASCNISTSTGQLTTSYGTIAMTVANPGNGYYISFNAPDGSYNYAIRGSIALSGTSIAYNTSSDYRLKKDIAPMSGALAKVALLKPVTYKWLDDSEGEGFIAHELAEVVPQCVTGKKDAVDDDGNPEYQGIDTSFLVATLTAALQEQQAIIENLKARLDAANL